MVARALFVVLAASTALAAEEGDISIFYSGESWGLGGGSCSGGEVGVLLNREPPRGVELALRETGFGFLHRDGRFVLDERNGALGAVDALSGKNRSVKVLADDVPMLVSDNGVLVQWPIEGFPNLLETVLTDATLMRKTSAAWQGGLSIVRGRVLRIGAPEGDGALAFELPSASTEDFPTQAEDYEFTPGVSIHVRFSEREGSVHFLCRTVGESTRRYPRLREAAAGVPADRRLMLAAGNDLPPAVTPLHESLGDETIKVLEGLGFDALAPAETELQRGIEWLRKTAEQHRLPYIAANLVWSSGPQAGKSVFPRYRILRKAGKTIVVVGIVPEEVRRALYGKRLGNATLVDSRKALDEALAAATAELGTHADLTILLSVLAGNDVIAAQSGNGIDLALGMFPSMSPGSEREQRAVVPLAKRPSVRRPLLVVPGAPMAFGQVDVHFARDELGAFPSEITAKSYAITMDLPVDPALRATKTGLILRGFHAGSDIVLPTPEEVTGDDADLWKIARADDLHGRSGQWEESFWHSLAAHASRDAMKAEVGAVRAFPLHVHSGGKMSAFFVQQGPNTSDHVVAVSLSGTDLANLAKSAVEDKKLVFAGFDPENRQIDGRALEPKQGYRVALPDSLVTDPQFESFFKGKSIEDGHSVSEVLVADLRRLRDQSEPAAYPACLRARLRPNGEGQRPLWTLSLEQLGLTYVRNTARNTTSFASVRDQRLKMPDFQLLTAKGTMSAVYDSAALTWRNAVAFKFNRIFFRDLDGQIPQNQREFEDSLNPETELRLKAIKLTSGKSETGVVPFLRGAFETEFTPVEIETAMGRHTIPRREYLSGTAGIGIFPASLLQEVRLGAIVQNDFAKEEGKALQIGMMSGLKIAAPIGPLVATLDASVTFFPNRGEEDAVDRDVLGLRAQSTFALLAPISSWFSFGVMADWLGFRGKVPSTDELGQSFQVGATLVVDRVWKPTHETFLGRSRPR